MTLLSAYILAEGLQKNSEAQHPDLNVGMLEQLRMNELRLSKICCCDCRYTGANEIGNL